MKAEPAEQQAGEQVTTSATTRYGRHREQEARLVTAVLALPCAAAVAGSVVPGLNDLLTTSLVVLVVLVVLMQATRLALRWRRERVEDGADAVVAAQWRARNPRSPALAAPVIATASPIALCFAPTGKTTP